MLEVTKHQCALLYRRPLHHSKHDPFKVDGNRNRNKSDTAQILKPTPLNEIEPYHVASLQLAIVHYHDLSPGKPWSLLFSLGHWLLIIFDNNYGKHFNIF